MIVLEIAKYFVGINIVLFCFIYWIYVLIDFLHPEINIFGPSEDENEK